MLALLLVLPGWQLNVNVNEFPLEGKLTGLFISPHNGGPATFGVGARWPVRVQRAAATGGSGKCVVSARRGYRGPRRCVVHGAAGLRLRNGPDRFAFVPRYRWRSAFRSASGSGFVRSERPRVASRLRPARSTPLGARRSGVTGTRAVNRKVVTRCETTPEVEVPASRRVEDRAIR